MHCIKITTTEGEFPCFLVEACDLDGFLLCHSHDGARLVNTEFIISIDLVDGCGAGS